LRENVDIQKAFLSETAPGKYWKLYSRVFPALGLRRRGQDKKHLNFSSESRPAAPVKLRFLVAAGQKIHYGAGSRTVARRLGFRYLQLLDTDSLI
jgi:hypothetical protein